MSIQLFLSCLLSSLVYSIKLVGCGLNALIPLLIINALGASNSYALFEVITYPLSVIVWIISLVIVIFEHKRFPENG